MSNGTQAPRPWWAPDAQGFVIGTVMLYVGAVLFYRMVYPQTIDDKILDMMTTILFGTAFVGILNYVIGSSQSSRTKDENQAKVAERLAEKVATTPSVQNGGTSVVVAWWPLLTAEEQGAITTAAAADPRIMAFISASTTGRATSADLAYLVDRGLLTTERFTAIQSA